jgi:hypothetical protein
MIRDHQARVYTWYIPVFDTMEIPLADVSLRLLTGAAVWASEFLPTYDVVGGPTTSYLPDVAYDVVGQDLRCRTHTTS